MALVAINWVVGKMAALIGLYLAKLLFLGQFEPNIALYLA